LNDTTQRLQRHLVVTVATMFAVGFHRRSVDRLDDKTKVDSPFGSVEEKSAILISFFGCILFDDRNCQEPNGCNGGADLRAVRTLVLTETSGHMNNSIKTCCALASSLTTRLGMQFRGRPRASRT
jgi:hypothetical protein